MPKLVAMGASSAVTIEPLAATSTKAAYMSQNTGLCSVWGGVVVLGLRQARIYWRGTVAAGGLRSASAATTTTAPWISANSNRVA